MSTPTATDQFVLDGSVTLAWLFHDEQDPYADAIVARLPDAAFFREAAAGIKQQIYQAMQSIGKMP